MWHHPPCEQPLKGQEILIESRDIRRFEFVLPDIQHRTKQLEENKRKLNLTINSLTWWMVRGLLSKEAHVVSGCPWDRTIGHRSFLDNEQKTKCFKRLRWDVYWHSTTTTECQDRMYIETFRRESDCRASWERDFFYRHGMPRDTILLLE